MDEKQNSRSRFIKTFLIIIAIAVVYAYGFQVTKINLEEPKKEKRQEQLTNVMRALAQPDLTEFDTERIAINTPIMVPCPATQFSLPDLSQPGPSVKLSTQCANPGSEITVSGSGFESGDNVLIFFVPYKADESEEVQLPLADDIVHIGDGGNFSQTVELRGDRVSENPQKVRVVVNRRSGMPRPSEAVYQTIEKIIETVFLALIATTLGITLAIPISFLARNLMIQVTTIFGSLVTLLAVAPLGWFLGSWLFRLVGGWGTGLIVGGEIPAASALWLPALMLLSVQAMATRGGQASQFTMLRSYGLGVLGALVTALALGLIAGLGQTVGLGLANVLGPFAFLGNFLFVLSDALAILLPLIGGFAGLFALVSLAGVISENQLSHAGETVLSKVFTIVMAILAGGVLLGLPAALITWLYQLSDPMTSIGWPAAIGAVILGAVSLLVKVNQPTPTGSIVYYTTRTILNVLRAIEPLIMAIVFVVWVGIGPFAGVMALMLHTIAALGKLYSEQVENISQGPIEAVTATGANRLQTIIYAVVPQIVPPYIAFTIYRWDINVRMSTIIGFAGGGGIGFLLSQNLNLLKYRQASVQMLAIAIVVSSLDFISAKIRERIV